jgi:EAL and modified HD-GYP domain-containing signal transduction protein
VATLNAGEKRSSELVVSAMVRARFCELLSPKVHHGESDLFLMGLLSMIDAILEIPMIRVLETISVDHENKAALMGSRPASASLRPDAGPRIRRLGLDCPART